MERSFIEYNGVKYPTIEIALSKVSDIESDEIVTIADYELWAAIEDNYEDGDKDAVLVENYHYTLRYENNINAGTATVYIEPINANDVNGSKTCTFTIKEHVRTVVPDARKEATCTETGITEGSHCSVCKKIIVVVV